MVLGVIFPALRMLYDAYEPYSVQKEHTNKTLLRWSFMSFTALVVVLWWYLSSIGSGGINTPVIYQGGMLYLNYEEDSAGVEICDTPTRLFIALESPANDVEARNVARNT
jgi:hypothetical protein